MCILHICVLLVSEFIVRKAGPNEIDMGVRMTDIEPGLVLDRLRWPTMVDNKILYYCNHTTMHVII